MADTNGAAPAVEMDGAAPAAEMNGATDGASNGEASVATKAETNDETNNETNGTAPAPPAVEVTLDEYTALSEVDRAALPLTQSRRKKLDKLLVAHQRKAAKAQAKAALAVAAAAASAAAAAAASGGGDGVAVEGGGETRRDLAVEEAAAKAVDDSQTRPVATPAGEKKRLSAQMAATYNPTEVEEAWYSWWDASRVFKVTAEEALARGLREEDRFVMVIPPPNVTGSLHLGHALMCAIQDCVTRWHRMHGRTALYVPGVDHAGIATQVVVEKQLARDGRPGRFELGREAFLREVWRWKNEKGGKICEQMRRMGSGLDWDREEFTMSDKLNAAVREAFVRFYDDGLIYRKMRLVNWSCALKTAISDIEVDTVELDKPTMLEVPGEEEAVEFGVIHTFAYKLVPVEGKGETEVLVATTRLETMLGDVAVAVHPDDPRYAAVIGRKIIHPFVEGRDLVVIADSELVKSGRGTGAVKVTPAHDPSDFACGRRHGLPEITMLNDDGTIHERCGPRFAGMSRYRARREIIAALTVLGLYRGKELNVMAVGRCSRSKDIVEPRLLPQWWMNCKDLAERSAAAVRDGELKLVPKTANATWFHWLDNIRDWCISRQLWWGHRIPAYKLTVEGGIPEEARAALIPDDADDGVIWIVGRTEKEAMEKARAKLGASVPQEAIKLEQDEDVLDTWFSSGLFPFSVFGWPEETEDMKAFFPTSLLETGYDILFFWVARMVMMSLGLTGKLPFHTVCLHSMVRDKRGRKMSKSVGNVIDPLYIIDGADLETLLETVRDSNLPAAEIEKACEDKTAEFPEGIPACGADSLRMGLLAYMTSAGDINLDVSRVINYRSFGNKLWNATRFALHNLGEGFEPSAEGLAAAIALRNVADRWILARLNAATKYADECLKAYKFGELSTGIFRFWMDDICAVYMENMKPVMKGEDQEAKDAARQVLFEVFSAGLRLLHPLMPFITEELYQRLPGAKTHDSIVMAPYPVYDEARCDESAERAMEVMKTLTQAIRGVAKSAGLKNHDRPDVFVLASDEASAATVDPAYVQTLVGCGTVTLLVHGRDEPPTVTCVVKVINQTFAVHVVVDGLIDPKLELQKLEASAADKRLAIQAIEKKEAANNYMTRVPEMVRKRDAENKASRESELKQIEELVEKFHAMI